MQQAVNSSAAQYPVRCRVCGSLATQYFCNTKEPVCGADNCHDALLTRYNMEIAEQE